MQMRGLALADFERIIKQVSADSYAGNVAVADDAHEGGRLVTARLRVLESRGDGARRSWTGRRIPAACWHAYRDVLAALFEEYPRASVRTAMAVYRGREGFEQHYPATADRNVGSQMQPAYMPDLCDCEEG